MISAPLTTAERVALVTGIFSDRNETDTVKRLCGADAQSVIDAIDEVLVHIFIKEE